MCHIGAIADGSSATVAEFRPKSGGCQYAFAPSGFCARSSTEEDNSKLQRDADPSQMNRALAPHLMIKNPVTQSRRSASLAYQNGRKELWKNWIGVFCFLPFAPKNVRISQSWGRLVLVSRLIVFCPPRGFSLETSENRPVPILFKQGV